MFVDASAICGILFQERDADELIAKLQRPGRRLISAMVIFEVVVALSRETNGDVVGARRRVKRFMEIYDITLVAIGPAEQEIALDAFDRYGKGRHPARLNMGDCFAYACARTHGAPLLFKGDDFSRTDVAVA